MQATHPTSSRSATTVLLAVYLLTLGVLVFLPSGRGMDLGDRINLDPFFTIDRALDLGPRSASFRLMVGNIVAFVPFGLLLPLVVRSRAGLLVTFGAALLLSTAIEIGQFTISTWLGYAYRSTDVDDVILNVTGALFGYMAYAVVSALTALGAERARR